MFLAFLLALLEGQLQALAIVGTVIGYVLVRTGFGFASGYRKLLEGESAGPVLAQAILLAFATLAFAWAFSSGLPGGRSIEPTVMPFGPALALGAFLFGIGMQLAGGCGSGSLAGLGAGSGRMLGVLVFFIAGSFLGSLHWEWWQRWPAAPGISLAQGVGWAWAAAIQFAAIAVVAVLLASRRFRAGHGPERLVERLPGEARFARPWPLAAAGILIPLLSLATAWLAGHPWTITWGHTLVGAKAAGVLGWLPPPQGFWQLAFPSAALARPLLEDVTTVMDLAIVLGAAWASLAMGRWRLRFDFRWRAWITAAVAGLLMGYGARLSTGCNIGAFVVGVASTSAHGWIWIVFAIPGNFIGLRLARRIEAAP